VKQSHLISCRCQAWKERGKGHPSTIPVDTFSKRREKKKGFSLFFLDNATEGKGGPFSHSLLSPYLLSLSPAWEGGGGGTYYAILVIFKLIDAGKGEKGINPFSLFVAGG